MVTGVVVIQQMMGGQSAPWMAVLVANMSTH
ncbi:hypothetical protein LVISKB_1993 [Levilactobacillus brevis KB290]|uniref:Uncharacterized protein n=1 Tax=Levilactobacillus brevis KB290 TaxID=1001583 RepID=M5AFQ4_LEVBR|nr:hypothetical protein LVISKB_1993 [Levilactobacillus brevis KB290]